MNTPATTIAEPEQVPAVVAINRVARDIDAIGKLTAAERGRGGGTGTPTYAFRSIEDIMNALHPILVEHGVLIVPVADHITSTFHERTTSSGNKSVTTQVHQRVEYHVYGPMGDYVIAAAFGEGNDVSDKAVNKSTSGALKYLLTTLFSIPTENLYDDGDTSSVETFTGTERPTPDTDALYERREAMRDTVAAMPDEVQQRVVSYLRDNDINLRLVCTKRQLDKVDSFIKTVATDGAENAESA